ncbi:amidohydrolase family protein [Neolewinella aurantiaca]|uniref:Amidohydrolase family protein n=1 Tax=Neolewinella aurantiaca TaxID=2602767 RepID=A0A5C7FX82_9BACT|nr:amidohydrolase family protein [Neolewinella aurantiaca]TXF90154.1 amidohydrolase family protein [Neolewinella aurantiaca]
MKLNNTLLFVLLLWFIPAMIGAQTTTYLHCGRIIDGTGGVLTDKTIVVIDNKISSIQDGFVGAAAGAKTVDLKGSTVMPGFIDLHVHVESELNPKAYSEKFTMNPADVALRATTYMQKTLMAGFTTVRDLGGSGVNISLRNAINAGYVEGPRIFTAEKAIATTGGHADPSNGRSKELSFDAGPDAGVINSADEAWKAVRTRYKNGADCIKITATGGVLSVAKDGQGAQFRDAELEAIVAAAKEYGMHTAAHAHGIGGMQRAIRAGITTIEHGTLMDEETADLMIKHGTYWVPTLSAGSYVAEKAKEPGFFPPIIVPKAISIGSQQKEIFTKMYKKGVKIAFGTDSGVSPHGDNAKEFGYLVECGVAPMDAITSATSTAAFILGQEKTLGQLKPGFTADIVAVNGNPLEKITLLEHVGFVMKGGRLVKE